MTSHSPTSSPELPSFPSVLAGHLKERPLMAEVVEIYGLACYEAGSATAAQAAKQVPIDMVLHCPVCGLRHVDAPEPELGPNVTGDGDIPLWGNPPHRSHLCHGCGNVWRPADVPTNGVQAVRTVGNADSPLSAAPTGDRMNANNIPAGPNASDNGACVQPASGEVAEAAQVEAELLTWYDGEPPFPQNQEWFIAETIYGDRVVLMALPDEYSYDYKTADQTYMKAENIKRWMQFPDCEYLPPEAPTSPQAPAPQAVVGEGLDAILLRFLLEHCMVEDEYGALAIRWSSSREPRHHPMPERLEWIRGDLEGEANKVGLTPHQGADALREALARLVRLEDERIRLQHLHAMGHGTDYDHYHKTLPIAWDAARAALAQHQAPQQGEPK